MADLPTRLISAEALRGFMAAIFRASGCDAVEAKAIAVNLVDANLTGHDSHGVIRVPRYVECIGTGDILVGQTITVLTESAIHAVLDGNFGFGQTVGPQAVDFGVARARAAGLSVVALRQAGHLGRIGAWAERAAEAGLISIHFVNVSYGPLVAPFGGTGRRFATDPVCIGIPPLAGRPMLLLDMATAIVAEGKAMVASMGGKPLPADALIWPDGTRSADTAALYGPLVPNGPRNPAVGPGAIRAFGEHKGSGLAFMCELLAGVLCGGGTAQPARGAEKRNTNGMLSIYLDPTQFGVQEFARQAMDYADYVKSAPAAAGVAEVLVPGEPEAHYRATREANGVPVIVDTWNRLCALADGLGVAVPD